MIPEFYYDGTPIPDHPAASGVRLERHRRRPAGALQRGAGAHPPPRPRLARRLGGPDAAQRRRAVDGERHAAPGRVRRGLLERAVRHPGNPSFVERQVMKPDGGAFAGFGDTRVSPTWPNNHMAYGFFDAMFPDTVPNFGSEDATRRLGDMLLSGKARMAAKVDGDGEYQEHFLYHLLGDPSAQAWVNTPVQIDVTKIEVELIPIATPDPGGPSSRCAWTCGEQGIATPTVDDALPPRRGGRPRRSSARASIEIVPETPIGRDSLRRRVRAGQGAAGPEGRRAVACRPCVARPPRSCRPGSSPDRSATSGARSPT